MIELVAHKDNSWPGAFRLMMKDTGFLLGIGHLPAVLAENRLREEGIEDDFHITFADGSQPAVFGRAEASPPLESFPEKVRAAYEKKMKQAVVPSVWGVGEPEVDDPFSEPQVLRRYTGHAGLTVEVPASADPFSGPDPGRWVEADRHGKPFFVEPAPKSKPKVEKFTLPALKPIEKRPDGAEKASVKRAEARKPTAKKKR